MGASAIRTPQGDSNLPRAHPGRGWDARPAVGRQGQPSLRRLAGNLGLAEVRQTVRNPADCGVGRTGFTVPAPALGSALEWWDARRPAPTLTMTDLSDLEPGTSAVVTELRFDEADSLRLMELGFIPGAAVSCHRRVPLGDLAVYQVDGSQIALRLEAASRISVRAGKPTTGRGNV